MGTSVKQNITNFSFFNWSDDKCWLRSRFVALTDWGLVTHISVSKLTSIDSDNSLSPGRCQAKKWWFTFPMGTSVKQNITNFSFFNWSDDKCWLRSRFVALTDWGLVTHISVSKLTSIDSDNSLSPGRCQAKKWWFTFPMGTSVKQNITNFSFFNWSDDKCWLRSRFVALTDWGLVTHISVSKLTSIDSDNSLSPGRCQAIFWTDAGVLSTWNSGTNFSDILIKIPIFSFKNMHSKMSSYRVSMAKYIGSEFYPNPVSGWPLPQNQEKKPFFQMQHNWFAITSIYSKVV